MNNLPAPKISKTGIDISLIKSGLPLSPLRRIEENDSLIRFAAEMRQWKKATHFDQNGCINVTVDFKEILRRLISQKVAFVLIGGQAAIAHGVTLFTKDFDVCCPLDADNLARIHVALADLHPAHRTRRDIPFEVTPGVRYNSLYLVTDIGNLDFLSEVIAIGNYQSVLKLSESIQSPVGAFNILSIDGLIQSKSALNRPQDVQAIAQLEEIKKLNTDK